MELFNNRYDRKIKRLFKSNNPILYKRIEIEKLTTKYIKRLDRDIDVKFNWYLNHDYWIITIYLNKGDDKTSIYMNLGDVYLCHLMDLNSDNIIKNIKLIK